MMNASLVITLIDGIFALRSESVRSDQHDTLLLEYPRDSDSPKWKGAFS